MMRFMRIRMIVAALCMIDTIAVSSLVADVIWDNGTYQTTGFQLSIGWNQSASTPFRFAMTDDFVASSPTTLTRLLCYGHMPGNVDNQPQIVAGYVRILADNGGIPGDVLFGDWETPLAVTETFTGDFTFGTSSRPIYRVAIELPDWSLCPGAYWVQFNLDNNDVRPSDGSLTGNYFTSLIASPPPEANGYHYIVLTDQLISLQDPDSGQGNAPPFQIEGEACIRAGDFDDDGNCTVLDIPDFVSALLSGDLVPCADMNSDCAVNGEDIFTFAQCILG